MIHILSLTNKYNKKTSSILGAILILIVVFFMLKSILDDKEIKNNLKLTYAVITYVHLSKSGEILDYYYFVNGKKFEGSCKLYIGYKNATLFVNKRFPIAYSKKNPKKNRILIHPNDFKYFNMVYPDSLLWVRELIENTW